MDSKKETAPTFAVAKVGDTIYTITDNFGGARLKKYVVTNTTKNGSGRVTVKVGRGTSYSYDKNFDCGRYELDFAIAKARVAERQQKNVEAARARLAEAEEKLAETLALTEESVTE